MLYNQPSELYISSRSNSVRNLMPWLDEEKGGDDSMYPSLTLSRYLGNPSYYLHDFNSDKQSVDLS
jgi:hypothetical protein